MALEKLLSYVKVMVTQLFICFCMRASQKHGPLETKGPYSHRSIVPTLAGNEVHRVAAKGHPAELEPTITRPANYHPSITTSQVTMKTLQWTQEQEGHLPQHFKNRLCHDPYRNGSNVMTSAKVKCHDPHKNGSPAESESNVKAHPKTVQTP